jgi:hypothetical protein
MSSSWRCLGWIVIVAALGATNVQARERAERPPAKLDPEGFALAFHDDFDTLGVTKDGGTGPWFAPVHYTFGAARLVPPGPNGPFSAANGELTIRASTDGKAWTSGTMQTVDSHGRGFSQRYGYFEMRARLPTGPATWPAFWLLTLNNVTESGTTRGEIDAVEAYGDQPRVLHHALHLTPGKQKRWHFSKQIKVPNADLAEYHTYGVMVTPTWVAFYFDREQTYEFPALPEYRQPLYMLVDLAMTPTSLERAQNPSLMTVDYVRAYALPPIFIGDR